MVVALGWFSGANAQATKGTDGICNGPCQNDDPIRSIPPRSSNAPAAAGAAVDAWAEELRRRRQHSEEAARLRQEQTERQLDEEHREWQRRNAEANARVDAQIQQTNRLAREAQTDDQQAFESFDEPSGHAPGNLATKPAFVAKDPDEDYTGKSCSYFTRPPVEANGGRLNYYANGSRVAYGRQVYLCEGGTWSNLGPTKHFPPADVARLQAARQEVSQP